MVKQLSVKDVIPTLVDDGLVYKDKIGNSDERDEALAELQASEEKYNDLKKKMVQHADSDSTAFEEMKNLIEVAHEAANIWTDNIFTLRKWCSNDSPQAKEQLKQLYREDEREHDFCGTIVVAQTYKDQGRQCILVFADTLVTKPVTRRFAHKVAAVGNKILGATGSVKSATFAESFLKTLPVKTRLSKAASLLRDTLSMLPVSAEREGTVLLCGLENGVASILEISLNHRNVFTWTSCNLFAAIGCGSRAAKQVLKRRRRKDDFKKVHDMGVASIVEAIHDHPQNCGGSIEVAYLQEGEEAVFFPNYFDRKEVKSVLALRASLQCPLFP